MKQEDVYMTLEQAEDIVMAAEVGVFRGSASELAHAILLIAATDEHHRRNPL